MGGIRYILLTHEDDVADASRYAKRFGSTRIIHREDLSAEPEAEWVVDGRSILHANSRVTIIPTPGHTRGSMVLLYENRYLFTGDHLFWDRDTQKFRLPSVYLWDESELVRSTERLLDWTYEWVLPGHGDRCHQSPERMREGLQSLVGRYRSVGIERQGTGRK